MALNDFSRFKNTELIVFDGVEMFGRWKQPLFLTQRPSDDLISTYQVTSQTEGRPDLIAHSLYGNAHLDWVLIAFNKVLEPFGWPRAGSLIEYPADTIVLSTLL